MPELQEEMVTRPEELAACCAYLAGCRRFGFDTEFVGEDSYHPHLCLVQVATEERLLLIDPQAVGPLDQFWNLVVDPANQVIVHAGREEVRLCHLWTGRTPGNLFDLQIAAGLIGMVYPLGHGNLVSQMLGVQLSKGETRTEWRDRPLTRAQIQYAFDDVRYLLPLWRRLQTRLEELDRLDWAREECARLATQSTPEELGAAVPVERWRKLRGVGSLDRRRLAVARALYAWREQTAARLNRPARVICRDDLLVEIARRNPSRPRDLHVIRGLPRRDLEEIVKVALAARALPLEQCPLVADREQDPSQVGLVTNILLAVLGDLCARRHLAPNLVAGVQDIKYLVRDRLQGMENGQSPREQGSAVAAPVLTQGWRARYILPELLAVLDGQRSVRIVDVSAEAPLVIEENAARTATPPDPQSSPLKG